MTKNFLNLKKDGEQGEINIYGEVVPESWRWDDEMSATHFKDQLDKFDGVKEITVNINSPGGSVYEGVAIYNMLKRHKAKVIVNIDGLAASIASVIAMAGDVVRIPSNAMLMVHNAMSMEFGNAKDMRETADLLDKITGSIRATYLEKTDKINEATLTALMDAETWLTADEAKHYGLVDEVITSKELVACASKERLGKFNKTPDKFMKLVETPKNAKALTSDFKELVRMVKNELEETPGEEQENPGEEEEKTELEKIVERLDAIEKRLDDLESDESDDEEDTDDDAEVAAQNKLKNILF